MAFVNQSEIYESGKDQNGNPTFNVALDNNIVDALSGARRSSADLTSHLSFLEEALVATSRELATERKKNEVLMDTYREEITTANQKIQSLEDRIREYEMTIEALENKPSAEVEPHVEDGVAPAEGSPAVEGEYKSTPVEHADPA